MKFIEIESPDGQMVLVAIDSISTVEYKDGNAVITTNNGLSVNCVLGIEEAKRLYSLLKKTGQNSH